MFDALELLGADEMKRNGGMWRALILGRGGHPPRPGKVRRVFETIRVEQLERKKIKTTWGCYAMHLYQLFADRPSDRNP
jgi:hypothetical protein